MSTLQFITQYKYYYGLRKDNGYDGTKGPYHFTQIIDGIRTNLGNHLIKLSKVDQWVKGSHNTGFILEFIYDTSGDS